MYHVKVKICGLREERHVEDAIHAGAELIGFVMVPSRRQVTPKEAQALARVAQLEGGALTVGVFVDTPAAEVNRLADYCRFDLVQVSGREDAEFCRALERPVIRVLHVAKGEPASSLVDRMERTDADLDGQLVAYLLDTYSETEAGGTGRSFDWDIAREVALRHPIMVAGGLNPDNVAALVSLVRPQAVDVSSGVERQGSKDTELIRAFVAEVRRAEKEVDHAGEYVA